MIYGLLLKPEYIFIAVVLFIAQETEKMWSWIHTTNTKQPKSDFQSLWHQQWHQKNREMFHFTASACCVWSNDSIESKRLAFEYNSKKRQRAIDLGDLLPRLCSIYWTFLLTIKYFHLNNSFPPIHTKKAWGMKLIRCRWCFMIFLVYWSALTRHKKKLETE